MGTIPLTCRRDEPQAFIMTQRLLMYLSFLCCYTDGAWYIISVAAEKAEVHEQTLRHYERLGLISPARKGNSPHSPRLYSDRDIERVVQIRSLMQDLGVNLAGVETILHMRNLIEQMQIETQQRIEQVQKQMEQEIERLQHQHVSETRRLKGIIERIQR